MVYMLAELLGKRIHEILEMSKEEFFGWVAYFNVKHRKQKQQR
jgi:hypothetical protein